MFSARRLNDGMGAYVANQTIKAMNLKGVKVKDANIPHSWSDLQGKIAQTFATQRLLIFTILSKNTRQTLQSLTLGLILKQ